MITDLFVYVDSFVVSPGDGREFVYSPVDSNATISCAVSELVLEWIVAEVSFDSPTRALELNSRRIFKSTTEVLPNGVTTSSVTVFGDISVNNNTNVCCRTIVNDSPIANCTTLIIYGECNE